MQKPSFAATNDDGRDVVAARVVSSGINLGPINGLIPPTGRTMATPPGMPGLLHVIAATPFVVTVLNAVVLGAIVAIIALRAFGLGLLLTLGVVGATFVATVLAHGRIARSNMRRGQRLVRPMFPTSGQPKQTRRQSPRTWRDRPSDRPGGRQERSPSGTDSAVGCRRAQSDLTAATSWPRPSFASAKSMPVFGLP